MGKEERYSHITNHVLAECAFTYLGERALAVRGISWPAELLHTAEERAHPVNPSDILPATTKFYLAGAERRFSFRELFSKLAAVGEIRPDIVYWQFQRHAARAACARLSEGCLWGFGRPHPTKPHFKPSQWHAGPLVDYVPGTAEKENWIFEPVFIRTFPDSASLPDRIFKIYPVWNYGEEYVELHADENPLGNYYAEEHADENPPDAPIHLIALQVRVSKGQRNVRQRERREEIANESFSLLTKQ